MSRSAIRVDRTMDQSPMGGGLPYTHHEPSPDEVRLAEKRKAERKPKPAVVVEAVYSIDWPPKFVAMAGKRG